MDYEEILKTISCWMEAYTPICEKDDSPLFQLEPPATEEEISAVEKQINRRLPDSLRTFFLCHARYLKLTAYFSDDFSEKLPPAIHSLFSAFLELSLDDLPSLNESCQESIRVCLAEPEHPSAAQLQNVLPLTWVPAEIFWYLITVRMLSTRLFFIWISMPLNITSVYWGILSKIFWSGIRQWDFAEQRIHRWLPFCQTKPTASNLTVPTPNFFAVSFSQNKLRKEQAYEK